MICRGVDIDKNTVCGAVMYPVRRRPSLGYIVYRCFHCKRTEKRYTDGNPWTRTPDKGEPVVEEAVEGEIRFSIGDAIVEVVDNLYRVDPRSYDEWDEP